MANAEAIQATAAIIAPHHDWVVVVSALQGVTDQLETLAAGDTDPAALAQLETTHLATLDAIHPAADDGPLRAVFARAQASMELAPGTPGRRDAILSAGEQASALLLAAALSARGAPARALDAAAAGIRTDGRFGSARPADDALLTIRAALAPCMGHEIPIVTGFYGVGADGQPTIFGRGGSDYVAALVAAALGADALELWKDVPGFLTADPRAVPTARMVPELDYGEAAELAYFGAKVLHPRAVEPIAELGIPIHIRTFANPDAKGTIIHSNAPRPRDAVRSAASRDGLAIVRLNGPGMGHTPGIGKRVFDALAEAEVNVLNMANSQATFALLIDDTDADAAQAALEPLVGGAIRSVEVLHNRSLVCVVGRGLGEMEGSAARIFDAVSRQHVPIDMISLGASEIAIDFIVPSADRARALIGLHDTFLAREEVLSS